MGIYHAWRLKLETIAMLFQALAAPATAVRTGRNLNPVARGQQVLEEVSITLPEANKMQAPAGEQSSASLTADKAEILVAFLPK